MTLVKICGLTTRADADAAVAYGADFVGFVLWSQSPRAITAEGLGAITRSLPDSVTPVGVFVDPNAGEIAIAAAAGIRVAQIHGDVPAGVALPIVRAVHLDVCGLVPPVDDELVLVDTNDPVRRGGTGMTIDWQHASQIARSRRVILAGGLTPENVAEAVAVVRPYAVDVASGVERQPGLKDHARMRAFIAAAKGIM